MTWKQGKQKWSIIILWGIKIYLNIIENSEEIVLH